MARLSENERRSTGGLATLARWFAYHPWRTILGWVAITVAAYGMGDGGEARALARAIRPDDAQDLARLDLPRHVGERGQRPVADGQLFDAKKRQATSRPRASRSCRR